VSKKGLFFGTSETLRQFIPRPLLPRFFSVYATQATGFFTFRVARLVGRDSDREKSLLNQDVLFH